MSVGPLCVRRPRPAPPTGHVRGLVEGVGGLRCNGLHGHGHDSRQCALCGCCNWRQVHSRRRVALLRAKLLLQELDLLGTPLYLRRLDLQAIR